MASHILIVDDDVAVTHGIARLLEQAGYQASSAYNARDANIALARPPDLIILDVMLPDQDGFSFCRQIRRLTPYIPILMLTACDELSDKVRGLELGADEYVTKPFEPRELLARVRAMLRFAAQRDSGRQDGDQPLVRGPITLWRSQRKVEVEGQPVDLTPREWALIEIFMLHPGQVFGRETLLRRVWGSDFLGESRVVDVHVQRLRAKLEHDPTMPRCIETVRGFGYRFVPQPDPACVLL
jgi:DNA-binding response OmpR family regulator